MKTRRNRWLQITLVWACIFCFLCPTLNVYADEIDNMENQSSSLQGELNNINAELLQIGEQIATNEAEMEAINNDIIRAQEQLQIAKNNEDAHYADMKVRIQYIYENNGESLLGMILSAENLSDFVNKVHFVQQISEYDRGMFNELQDLRFTIEDEEKYLQKQKDSYKELENELTLQQDELVAKAAATSTDLDQLQAAIATLKAEKAAQQSAPPVAPPTNNGGNASNNNESNSGNSNGSNQGGSSNGGNSGSDNNGNANGGPQNHTGPYQYPSGPGQLNPWVGVVYFNGHRETYYSQKVLPGYGLNIPGRHVASDGTVRDANGFLCLASSDHPKGTIIETSLGTGKVYDSGCASGTVDIYTDW